MIKKYTITVDYCATGEGRTLIVYYTFALNKDDALANFIQNELNGDYFSSFAEVHDGFIFDHYVTKELVTSIVKNQIEDDRCMRSYSAKLYFNYA